MNNATKITNRLGPCRCGCMGRDSQHAATFTRVLRDEKILDSIEECGTYAYGLCQYIATATFKHPSGTKIAVFAVTCYDGIWIRLGWTVAR